MTVVIPELSALLDDLAAFVGRFIAFDAWRPDHVEIVALWIVHTYVYDEFETTPYLSVSATTMRAGKSLLLKVLRRLVARPQRIVGASSAAMYRLVADRPTLLIDELDASRVPSEMRAILNSGFQADGSVPRVEGGEVVAFSTFCPKAFAGIGSALPATTTDRAIVIKMIRRPPGQTGERLGGAALQEAADLRRRLEEIAGPLAGAVRNVEPPIIDLLDDRAQDIWEPLLVIGEVAGQGWARKAESAARNVAIQRGEPDPALRLLADLRKLFPEVPQIGVLYPTADLLDSLGSLQARRQADYKEELDPMTVARLLRPLDVRPRLFRPKDEDGKKGKPVRGYSSNDLIAAWRQYLPPELSRLGPEPVTAVTETPETAMTGVVRKLRDQPAEGMAR
jgi:hypothetical protein